MGRIAAAFRFAFTSRQGMGYTLAMTVISGALFGFINSSQQIFFDVFEAPGLFPVVFALVAAGIAVASILNARLVEKLGSRLIAHAALFGFIGFSLLHALIAWLGYDSLWMFAAMQACKMFCFGFIAGNFGAMAMEPMGHIAGTASSAQGFISSIGGALLGFAIGQQFDGTTVPMTVGFALLGVAALALVLAAEQGRLFKARHLPPVAAET